MLITYLASRRKALSCYAVSRFIYRRHLVSLHGVGAAPGKSVSTSEQNPFDIVVEHCFFGLREDSIKYNFVPNRTNVLNVHFNNISIFEKLGGIHP